MGRLATIALCVLATSCSDAVSDAGLPDDASATSRANGTVGAWQSLPPLPVPRANHCSVVANGYLVVLGGNHQPAGAASFVSTDTVYVALLAADGTIGPWILAGRTPSAVTECTAASDGSTLYLVDGIFDHAGDQAKVWTAELSSAGELGAWSVLGPLPQNVRALYANAWIVDRTLYAMDSKLPSEGDVTVTLRASLSPVLGPWHEDDWLPGFRGHPQYAFTGSFFYVLGGYLAADADDVVVDAVNGAARESDGTIGAAFATQPLPAPTGFGTVIAVDDFLFLVGGKDAIFTGQGKTSVASAPVGTDGQLGGWSARTPLPQGRTNHAAALGGDFLYVTGGGLNGPGLDTVLAAQVRF